jgi:hypothetical protein
LKRLVLPSIIILAGFGLAAVLLVTGPTQVVRTEGELDPQTRMINVVARVESPYAPAAGRAPLAVGLFLDVKRVNQYHYTLLIAL